MAHFFKVILEGTIQDRKLVIPSKFVKKYANTLPDEVTLIVPNGAKWKVELVKNGGRIWFQNGWPQFVNYYSISHGSFLVFGYHKIKCCFHVTIFDTSASEIDYPLWPDSQSEFIDIVVGKMNALVNQLTNPSFSVTMHPTYVGRRCRLNVPLGFSRRYFKNQNGNVIFESMNGVTYPAKYTHFKKRGKKATRQIQHTCIEIGWTNFVRDNHLAVGDVCVFELINASENTLRVAIVRGSKDGNKD